MAVRADRYLPDLPLPAYSYVPGRSPHPSRDPGGHQRDGPPLDAGFPGTANWRDWTPYLRGVDLFNHGYYWEAHEAWETAWHACGRRGPAAELLRGLIHLAGAGFATRRGKPAGRARHAALARVRFRVAREGAGGDEGALLGLDTGTLDQFAARVGSGEALVAFPGDADVAVVFNTTLHPA